LFLFYLSIKKTMTDVIVGSVTRIIDSASFKISVAYYRDSNATEYKDNETIRIAGLDNSTLNEDDSLKAKKALEQKLNGKSVKCTIQERDAKGRIVAKIQVL